MKNSNYRDTMLSSSKSSQLLYYQITATLMFVITIFIIARAQPNKLWTVQVNNSTGNGKDWATGVMEDAQGDIIAAGFSSWGSGVVPALYKLHKDSWLLWGSDPKYLGCNNNYGAASSVIQKKSGSSFGNYIVITKEKPCGGGVDRTGVYEVNLNTGAVVTSNQNVMSSQGWYTSSGVGILQKPDGSGYIITGYFSASSYNPPFDIYVAFLDNSLNLTGTVYTYGYSGDDRPSSIEYVYSGIHYPDPDPIGGRSPEGSTTGTRLSNGGYYNGTHQGYIIAGKTYNSSNGTDDVYILRLNTDGTLKYEDIINSGSLSSPFYTREHTTSNSCSPGSLNGNDVGGKVVQLSEIALCFNNYYYDYDEGHYFAIGAVFNEYHCSSCGCGFAEYKEGDAVMLIYQEINGTYNCTDDHELVKATNLAHMSGGDFQFSFVAPGYFDFISFGSTRDNGVLPAGNTATHFYLMKHSLNAPPYGNDADPLWSKVFVGDQSTIGCGFGLDMLNDGKFIVCGNNIDNNDDAVFVELGHECVGTPLTTAIASNTTWNAGNAPHVIDREIHVQYGATLTISGTTVKFASECSGIVVEDGGVLSVDNSTLTKADDGDFLWEGIQGLAGYIFVSNSSVIEHAAIGIEGTTHAISGTDYSTYVYVSQSTFRNNQTAIKYDGKPASPFTNYIISSNFSIDNNVQGVVINPVRLIELTDANAFNISGTTFSDVVAGLDVQAINKQAGDQLYVSGSTFNGVDKGIYLQGSSASDRILDNTFTNIPAITIMPCCGGHNWGSNYGLFTVGSDKYRAEGNSFTGIGRLNVSKIYGIVTDNSGASGALMFDNDFTNTSVGFQSQNNNANFAASCNTFTGYAYNGTYGPAWYTYNGSMRQQGNNSCTNSADRAGNEWTSLCTGGNIVDIKVNASSYFTYYTHTKDIGTSTEKVKPNCSTTAWESAYLSECLSGQAGYQKTAAACNTPFYTCSGCRLAGNDLGIDPQLLAAMDYYRGLADASRQQWVVNNRDEAAKEQLAFYAGQEQLVSNEISGQLLSRSIDTAILYLEASDLFEDKKLLAELYLGNGRYQDCRNLLDSILAEGHDANAVLLQTQDVTDYETENTEFVTLLNLLLGIYESGRNLDQAQEQELTLLEELSNSNTVIGPKACAYLKLATGRECSYEIYSDEVKEEAKKATFEDEESPLALFPNPANDMITLKMTVNDDIIQPSYHIYEISGKLLLKGNLQEGLNEVTISTREFPEGLYIFQLRNMDGVIEARKFSVVK